MSLLPQRLSETMVPSRYSDRAWLILFFAGLLALLVIRVLALKVNVTDLFYDEAQYWFWSENLDFGYYSKPAVIAGVIRTATEVCGLSEFCIRLPSPLIHTVTAIAVFFLGRQLYDVRIGVIAGLLYATLPAVSLSSSLISTDVPLLFFWAVALGAFVWLLNSKSWWPALILGLAFGLGLNAKYAMIWFVMCAGIYLALTPERRYVLWDARIYVALVLGLLMLVPNILWNVEHQFATVSHTADNANWQGPLVHPNKALEFFLAQFGVFGPILFAVLLVIVWRAWREGLSQPDRLLLAFALPVIIFITLQAFISRAHANWAAVSYIAGSVLVTAAFVRLASWRWLTASFAIHLVVLGLLVLGTTFAGQLSRPGVQNPFARVLGWQTLADKTQKKLDEATTAGQPFDAVMSDKRSHVAQFLYYLRKNQTPVYAWHRKGKPAKDHFQLTRPYRGEASDRVLLVTVRGARSPALEAFESVKELAREDLTVGHFRKQTVVFYALSGYKGE